jgi:hypothetical protein
MYKIHGKIQGVAPFLYNRMVDPESLNKTSTGGKPKPGEREAEAEMKVYKDEDGLYLPRWNFKKCLLLGVQKAGLKEGRAGMAPFLEATVFLEEDPHFTGKKERDYMDERVGRIPPKTGAAAIIRRPALQTGWELPFTLTVVDDRRDADAIRRGLEEAGLLVGLGSFRPEHGRFIVTEWEIEKA